MFTDFWVTCSPYPPSPPTHTHTHTSAGDLVLMDAGCEYYGYVSDVTRTWPVSGKFSPAQRDLYEAVLRVKQKSIQVCVCVYIHVRDIGTHIVSFPGLPWLQF